MSATIAYTTVSSATMVASLAGGVLSFMWAKAHGDPVRNGLKWVQVGLVSQFIGSLLKLAVYAHSLAERAKTKYPMSNSTFYFSGTFLNKHGYQALYVSNFFSAVPPIALFVALMDVSIGIRVILNAKPKRANCQRWTAKIMGIIMTLFAFANMIGWCLSIYWVSRGWSIRTYEYRMLAFQIMALILQALLFIGFTWILVLAIKVSRRVNAARCDGTPIEGSKIFSLYYASVGVMWFSTLFWIAFIITNYTLLYTDRTGNASVTVSIMSLTNSILGSICPTASLILLVVVSRHKTGGLWTASSVSEARNKMTDAHEHAHQAQSHIM